MNHIFTLQIDFQSEIFRESTDEDYEEPLPYTMGPPTPSMRAGSVTTKNQNRIIPNYKTKAGGALCMKSPRNQVMAQMQINLPSRTSRNPSIRDRSYSRSWYVAVDAMQVYFL